MADTLVENLARQKALRDRQDAPQYWTGGKLLVAKHLLQPVHLVVHPPASRHTKTIERLLQT